MKILLPLFAILLLSACAPKESVMPSYDLTTAEVIHRYHEAVTSVTSFEVNITNTQDQNTSSTNTTMKISLDPFIIYQVTNPTKKSSEAYISQHDYYIKDKGIWYKLPKTLHQDALQKLLQASFFNIFTDETESVSSIRNNDTYILKYNHVNEDFKVLPFPTKSAEITYIIDESNYLPLSVVIHYTTEESPTTIHTIINRYSRYNEIQSLFIPEDIEKKAKPLT
ncbi:hypothetical protein EJF36_15980 [Bacillus sp. HMF5848]|uniref:DUF6612 family protein n=1 Tax=Bacillus sp. HMF5848 TaxID=2495421 RepID=UPI000F7B6598|nr:DUF6612 family protein [Bacillus sp. HMF5848]RSK28262.1 hypothetical protein EJF36_15980 [Bacillus sp. HMF5848]